MDMTNGRKTVVKEKKSVPANSAERIDINQSLRQTFVDDIRTIIDDARRNAVRCVDFCRVQMYSIAPIQLRPHCGRN